MLHNLDPIQSPIYHIGSESRLFLDLSFVTVCRLVLVMEEGVR